MKQTQFCDECKHQICGDIFFVCDKGHNPRFYQPKSQDDDAWGYKRKCAEFEKRDEKKGKL